MTNLSPVDAMTNDYRAMCAELAEEVEHLWSIVRDDNNEPHSLATRARALLAQPEPVAPTDEELLRMAASAIEPYESSGIALGEYEPETECAVEVYGNELIAYARAVLARWGQPEPQPPADDEVAVALIELRSTVMGLDQMKMYVAAQRVKRAADLLERFASPARLVINSSPEAQ